MPLPTQIQTPNSAELRIAALSSLTTPGKLTIVAGVFIAVFVVLLISKIVKSVISKILLALLIAGLVTGILYYYSLITIRF